MVTSVLPEGYKYLIEEEKYCSPTNYECSLRIRGMSTEEQARKWIELLNDQSLVTWKVLRTYPKSGKINVYKGEFRCQHRVHGKRKDMKKSKNTNCPARLRVCIRRYLKGTNAKFPDPLTKLWPCVIELKNVHNHSVESADSLQYRPVNEATRKKVAELFTKGHSPTSVSESLKLDLLIENAEMYEEREKDASYCPLPSFCYREYSKIMGNSYRSRHKNTVQMELQALLSPYINDEQGGRAVISSVSDHLVVCICTPIMQKIHTFVSESRCVVYLQAFGHPDKKTRLFLFTTWIHIGEVPLGVIITDTESLEAFTAGLQLLKSIFPPGAFFGVGWAELFVLPDDDARRRDPMIQEFPNSIILTSKFHQLRTFIEFLNDPKNQIPECQHQSIFKKFIVMLNSNTDEEFLSNFEKLSNPVKPVTIPEDIKGISSEFISNSSFSQRQLSHYMKLLWTESNGFATVFRPGLFATPLENVASESVQILSHILLAEIFDRVKSFNLVQLSHFVISSFEKFISLRLTCSTYADTLLKIFLPSRGQVNLHKVKKLEDRFFEVPSEDGSESVEMSILYCSCGKGRLCSHQSAVIHKFYTPTIPYPFNLQALYADLAGRDIFANPTIKKSSVPIFLLPKQNTSRCNPLLDGTSSGGKTEHVPEIEEGKALIEEISHWFSEHLIRNPRKFVPALKNMARQMETLTSDHEARLAIANFGTGHKPLRIVSALESVPPPLPSPPEPPPLIPTAGTQEVSFITTLGPEADEILGGMPSTTYLPLQEIPGEDGASGYFILVTDNKGGINFSSEEPVQTISVEGFEEEPTPPQPKKKSRKPRAKKIMNKLE